MGKINVAEILKDCPQGMKLDCTIFNNVTFDCVADGGIWIKHIDSKDGEHSLYVYNDGSFPIHNLGSLRTKCVIFPNGKTSWDGFVPPCKFKEPCKFKDGDVVVAENKNDKSLQLFLLERLTHSENANRHDGDCYFGWDFQCNALFEKGNWSFSRLATEEEKQKFFDTIKANGYKWNPETKTPEKLIESKFKVGNWYQCTKSFICNFDKNTAYYCAKEGCLQDEYGCHIAIVKDLYDNFKLWTIEDAKDGDVLAINWYKGDDYWEKIIIFKKYHNGDVTVEGYGNTFKNGELVLNKEVPYFSKTWTVSLHPATKEQRELLFQKIKEAGYKWNPKTKTPEKLPIEKSEIENNIIDIVKENDNRFRIVLNHQFDMEVDEGEYYAVRRPELLSNIWHNIDEEPIYVNGETPIIIDSNYGHISCEGHYYNEIQWKNHIESQRYREFKWAYEKDLMNL